MAFPAEFLEELKKRNGIVDVINSYVPLKRAGNLYKACCPFHNEKTPSFSVYTGNDEHFYCYGCGAGGDVITFVMKAENTDYPSAVELLARRANLTVPNDGYNREASDKRKRTLDANREAARFFHSQLVSGNYPEASGYIKSRRLEAAVNRFGLGFCPPGKKLFNYMTDLGFKPKELQDAFLCNRGNYDIFENRIIFPVIDASGNVVGFSARSMEKKPADGRKYINTNDTAAFNKRRNLFALNLAKNCKSDYFILCEGQTDVIALHLSGFDSAIASLGTSFTEEQAQLIRRFRSKVLLCYDGDEAGRSKAIPAIKILNDAGIETKVIALPDGFDPDEFIQKYGKDRFELLIGQSIGQMDYRIGKALEGFDITSADGRVAAADKLAEIISASPSPVEREIYTEKYAKKLEVSPESLKSLVETKRKKAQKGEQREQERALIRQSAGYGDTVNRDKLRMPKAAYAEEALIGIAQINPEFIAKAEKAGVLTVEDFRTEFNKRVYAALSECVGAEGRFDISFISDRFSADEIGRIMHMRILREDLSDNGFEVFRMNADALRGCAGTGTSGADSFGDIRALIEKKKKSDQPKG